MKGTSAAISDEAQFKSAIDKLEELLRRQLDLARKGDITQVEVLAEKTHELLEQIAKSGFLAGSQFEERRERLEQLYGRICLALSAHMDEVSQALGRVYKGKKTMTLYRDNI